MTKNYFEEAMKARAYMRITQEQGPSQQLLDFINYDGSLGNDLGLESFNTFSTQAQHEILLSKLDPETLDQMGLEDLKSKLNKLGMALGAVGFGAAAYGKFDKSGDNNKLAKILGVALTSLLASHIVLKKADKLKHSPEVLKYSLFSEMKTHFNDILRLDQKQLQSIPNDFRKSSWESYYTFSQNFFVEQPDKNIDRYVSLTYLPGKKDKMVDISKSGWTPDNFKEAVKWYSEALDHMEQERLKYFEKIKKIDRWVQGHRDDEGGDYDTDDNAAVYWLISMTVPKLENIFHMGDTIIKNIHRTLVDVSEYFKIEMNDDEGDPL